MRGLLAAKVFCFATFFGGRGGGEQGGFQSLFACLVLMSSLLRFSSCIVGGSPSIF